MFLAAPLLAPLPFPLAGRTQYLDSRIGTTVVGATCTAWTDADGSGRDVAEVAGSAPGFTLTGLNGLPSLLFTAVAGKYLEGAWAGYVPGTVYLVWSSSQTVAKQFAMVLADNVAAPAAPTLCSFNSNIAPARIAGNLLGVSLLANYAMAATGTLSCSVQDASGSALYADDMNTPIASGAAPVAANVLQQRIGISQAALAQPLNGYFCVALCYSLRHTAEQRGAVKARLRSVWGILGG